MGAPRSRRLIQRSRRITVGMGLCFARRRRCFPWATRRAIARRAIQEHIMSASERVDALVLGSGQGGKLLAWHMARAGRRTASVERRYIGGSCPNIACMPSKNEVWSARVAHFVRHAAEFGTIVGSVATDMAKVRQRKREMVEHEVALHLENYRAERRRTDHGKRALRRAEDARGAAQRRRHPHAGGRAGVPQSRIACGHAGRTWPGSGPAAHAYRGA